MSSQDEQESIGGSLQGGGFYGRYDYILDAKKRFSIPADWRDAMRSPTYVYIVPDPEEQYLHLLPPEEMEKSFRELNNRALFDETLDQSLSLIHEYVDQVRIDGQGRIRVSDLLLNYAMIEDTVVMVGAKNRAQLWSLKLRPATGVVNRAAFSAAYKTYSTHKSKGFPNKQ